MTTKLSSKSVIIGLCVVVIALTVVLLLIIQQNLRLRDQLASLTRGAPDVLKAGDRVGPITVVTMAGVDSSISFPVKGKSSLLFVLSPACPYCDRNMEWWSFLTRNLDTAVCNVVAISIFPLNRTREYLQTKLPGFVTVIGRDTSFMRSYKIASVPQTILIRPGGIVHKVWSGNLSNDQLDEIRGSIMDVPRSS